MRRVIPVTVFFFLLGCAGVLHSTPPNTYDAVAIRGFGKASAEPLPAAGSGEVVLRYNRWSLRQLSETAAGKQYFTLSLAGEGGWLDDSLSPGVYHLKKGEKNSVLLMASALLAYRVEKGVTDFDSAKDDSLMGMVDALSCKKGRHPYGLIGLYWSEDKLYLEQDYCKVQGGGIWEAKM